MVVSRGSRSPRSSRLISVRCSPHSKPSCSWETCFCCRAARRLAAKPSIGERFATSPIVELRRQKIYRQNISPGRYAADLFYDPENSNAQAYGGQMASYRRMMKRELRDQQREKNEAWMRRAYTGQEGLFAYAAMASGFLGCVGWAIFCFIHWSPIAAWFLMILGWIPMVFVALLIGILAAVAETVVRAILRIVQTIQRLRAGQTPRRHQAER
jgi:hypothetical protein